MGLFSCDLSSKWACFRASITAGITISCNIMPGIEFIIVPDINACQTKELPYNSSKSISAMHRTIRPASIEIIKHK